MSTTSKELALSANRAEELGFDVWDTFVLPSSYDASDLKHLKKPRVIIGGRGCGKTTLLRYLSHDTAFSRRRINIPDSEIEHIGLYWRVDTQFSAILTTRGLPDDVWIAAFQHLAALVIATEMLRSCQSVAQSKFGPVAEADLTLLNFARLSAFDPELRGDCTELLAIFERKLWMFQTWANNVRNAAPPTFYPAVPLLTALIAEIRSQLPGLREANYFVYLDEYENLLPLQQRVVNTWLKHSEAPLIFNVATKRNGMETRATLGSESIADIHDFRQYDIEQLESNFDVFAAEVLFMRLSHTTATMPIDAETLRDPAMVRVRRKTNYMVRVRRAATRLFPQETLEEIAAAVVSDPQLERRLLERTSRALLRRRSELPADAFINATRPEASVIVPALLSRAGVAPELVLDELRKLAEGEVNRFSGKTGWIHNNLFGAILQLYDPLNRPCPLYAGFGRFVLLAKNNIRHFLELCHKAMERSTTTEVMDFVPVEAQAQAARRASAAFLQEIKSFGRKGNSLHAFTLRLGTLFALAHQRPSLSEPEQNHFVVVRGRIGLSEDAAALIREAVKWSILFEEEGTKKKSAIDPDAPEYVLNPIYSPYFHISYRKKRRLELSSDDFVALATGSYDEVRELTSRFARRWSIEGQDAVPSLFGRSLFEEQS